MPDPSLSIVLPCFNPLEDCYEVIKRNYQILSSEDHAIELLIVNDGSNRNFYAEESIRFFQSYPLIKIISYSENRGKGYALREGIKQAKGDYIIYTDIDFPYTVDSFLKLY